MQFRSAMSHGRDNLAIEDEFHPCILWGCAQDSNVKGLEAEFRRRYYYLKIKYVLRITKIGPLNWAAWSIYFWNALRCPQKINGDQLKHPFK